VLVVETRRWGAAGAAGTIRVLVGGNECWWTCRWVERGTGGWKGGVGGSSGPGLASVGRRRYVLGRVGLRWPALAVVGL
jgi:hypothetical protein